MSEVAILLLKNCQPSAVFTVIEALCVANFIATTINRDANPPFSWRRVSLDGRPVRAMCGVSLQHSSPKSICRLKYLPPAVTPPTCTTSPVEGAKRERKVGMCSHFVESV